MSRSGRDREVSDHELLVAGRDVPEPVFTATEVGERVGMSQQGVDKRLRELAEDGLINTAMKGASRVWWLSYRGRQFIDEE
ncbi:winged helix-turn-helix transcriptional regulator [Halorientalis brevis]|uniref:Winged helix-turn-helix transcriptional regulator n=1 Tax=Halorientalis brevis TaxID=1126241 RepID=A0ABD6CDI7_9EURY|nr:winged helix-turn-helix transcriptional regulator [Halorientalis brevis]